jgi:hypothetical protein
MTNPKCKYYENCSAPLCPLDEESLEFGIWYPDEEICRKRGIDWVKKQKKIVKVGASADYYFDYQSLKSIKQIRKGIKGQDPDKPIRNLIKKDKLLEEPRA